MRGRLLVAAVLALALTLRLGLAVLHDPPPPTGDAADYARHAQSIRDHGSYPASGIAPGPTAFRPPAYPIALAAVGEDGARVFGAVVGTVSVALLGLIALWLLGEAAALAAMLVAAAFPPLIMVSVAMLSEGLFIALVLGAVAAALAARRRDRVGWVIAAGVLAGAAALTRTNGLVVLVPLLLLLPRRRLVLVAAALLVVVPWTVRTTTAFDELVPSTTQAGFTLAGAYNDEARTDDEYPAAWRPPTMAPYAALRDGRRDEAALERAFRGEALGFAADHPLYPPRVVFWASVRMLNLADPELERLSAREAGAPGWLRAANRYAIWALVLAAVAGVATRRPPLWLWLLPALLWLSVAIAIGATRYRTPVDPFLILLAAPALVRWRRA